MIEYLNKFVREMSLNDYFDDPEKKVEKIVTKRRKKI